MSVTRTPKFSSMTTTSPLAISLLLTKNVNRFTCKLIQLNNRTLGQFKDIFNHLVVLPNSTVTLSGISNSKFRFVSSADPMVPIVNYRIVQVEHLHFDSACHRKLLEAADTWVAVVDTWVVVAGYIGCCSIGGC